MTIRNYEQRKSRLIVYDPLDNVPGEHPCFIVDELVENLYFSNIHSKYEDTAGNPVYNRKIF
ncbi:MAG: hypothetical protein LBB45_03945 [Methanobrevibacter sp.]|jgi:hypothetical protein|nr:hypothetical protein [Candidatus Methanovirga basalitermitum]